MRLLAVHGELRGRAEVELDAWVREEIAAAMLASNIPVTPLKE